MNIKTKLIVILMLAFSPIWSQSIQKNGRGISQNPVKVEIFESIGSEVLSEFISDQDEQSNAKDQVILDDLIVTGSIAVGLDAVNGEVFGFNTVILKENNVRLKFDDTSVSGTFPNNDWILEANSSANGGTNHFAIQDATALRNVFMVEAGARANALYIEDSGEIGIGTDSPTTLIHAAKGDTPTLRLDQDGTSGWPLQAWDLAGNEANFFIRDVTNGSTLPFRIQPGTPTDALTLRSTGFVGVGTWAPTANLDVVGDIKLSNNLKMTPILTVPASPVEGDIYMDGTEHALKVFDGTEWQTAKDNQDLVSATLSGTMLEIEIENGTSVSVDLQPLLADLEARVTALENSVSIFNPDNSTAKLYQNTPNPYGTHTSIGFNIPEDVNHALLKITDIKGVVVKEITIYDRGKSGFLFDENLIPAGTYFYSLILDGKKLESKIMVKVD